MNHMQTPMGMPHTLMPDPDPEYNSMKSIIARVEAREVAALKAELAACKASHVPPGSEADIRSFCQSTYEAAANLAQWNRADLEANPPKS